MKVRDHKAFNVMWNVMKMNGTGDGKPLSTLCVQEVQILPEAIMVMLLEGNS
jgi:hypothetical protein